MSVINSMLRDLDRRHAPLPVKTNVQPAVVQSRQAWPRSAVALCILMMVAIWSWNHRTHQTTITDTTTSIASAANTARSTETKQKIATPNNQIAISDVSNSSPDAKPSNRRSTDSFAMTRREPFPGGSEAASMPPTVTANKSVNRLAPQKRLNTGKQAENPTTDESTENKEAATIVKQERKTTNELANERYQLARAALAQNDPQRAYDLLHDNAPALADASDYHAVLAAVEQQLGHYSDAVLHYQQLLTLDQNQASWWLGLGLSLEGDRRGADALAAYRRAAQLNTLPDAARQYTAARIAALAATNKATAE